MTVLVTDPDLGNRLIAERQHADSDRFDEVWEGLYIMAPLPNDNHQEIQAKLVAMLQEVFGWDSPVKVRAGVNVSDLAEGWTHNYRAPDVVVFLPGNPAVNHDTHWQGGPDFLVEIASEGDRAVDKLPFYASVGVREVLIIHRKPWVLELYASTGSPAEMRLAGTATVDGKTEVRSGVLPIALQLLACTLRPKIKVTLTGAAAMETTRGRTSWLV